MKTGVRALEVLEQFLETSPDVTRKAAALAFNTILPRKAVPQYKRVMKTQVGFPTGYLEEADKFGVTQFATPDKLESVITARQRPTSLARFATGGGVGQEGLAVRVKAGRTTRLRKAFLVRLRVGTVLDNDNFNLGLAVRVPGGRFRNKKDQSRMVHLAKDVFLLYGPSVDQVFRAVAETETPAVLNQIEAEFFRQFARLS